MDDGFDDEQAAYGVDNCGADWNEQAKLAAESYLSFIDYTHEDLVEELEYDGFTHEQAEYGATAAGV